MKSEKGLEISNRKSTYLLKYILVLGDFEDCFSFLRTSTLKNCLEFVYSYGLMDIGRVFRLQPPLFGKGLPNTFLSLFGLLPIPSSYFVNRNHHTQLFWVIYFRLNNIEIRLEALISKRSVPFLEFD